MRTYNDTYVMEICPDCAIAHANGDFTGMDDARETAVKAGMDRTGHLVVISEEDGSIDTYFSWDKCDACGDRLGGDRMMATPV
jgi:hypothetical protein